MFIASRDGRLRAAAGPSAGAGSCAWAGDGSGRSRHKRIAELERKIGQQTLGSGFFAKSLQAFKGNSPEEYRNWRESIYAEIGSMMQFDASSHDAR